ncbi:MBL fold metallo-hydrolase [Maribacter sp. PR1]|uniref:beta-lactamase n=1 Tax=Maribacter cobaltidurans TaxID=1178778 RepID=A0ABU7IUR0_9FLAO|nr:MULTISPECIES: MBL fold metallo-hydrolase [Maribacter]MDC6389331.1 MBL fold metallo-hydrolase [Maribacter sp. PR1]MEE1976719.1 MBL fold metallo-hydrolase [Maribacter cobaltidurans]
MLKLKLPFIIFLISSSVLLAQRDFSTVEITSEKLTENVYALFGAGGNIGLAIGDDAAYLIDDQFGPLTEKIVAHVQTITDKPINFVLNTHMHGDHTGGNGNLANAGALVIAHENVRKRMVGAEEPRPKEAWPVVTFNDKMTLYLKNGKSVHAMHVNPAHTDGDTYYYFPEDNVIHMGDNFFSGRYPYLDLGSGGDIDGLISNTSMALELIDDETKIIPGHGAISYKSDLKDFTEILITLRERIKNARSSGKSLEETQKMGLSKEWDDTHGQGFINADRIVEFIYKSAD